MITRIKVRNFKSLVDFEMAGLAQFTCFIGLNGAGKTTLLQFLGFIRALLAGRIKEWFEHQRWKPTHIIPFGSSKRTVEFEIDITKENMCVTWEGRFNTLEMRCVHETVYCREAGEKQQVLLFEENKLKLHGADYSLPAGFRLEGSICTTLLKQLPEPLSELVKIGIFGVLDPSAIPLTTQTKTGTELPEVQANGNGLVGFVSQLGVETQRQLFEKLREFYPSLQSYKVKTQKFGWRNLLFSELENAFFDASHLSYGTLRLLVILSHFYSSKSSLVFDEIENGINQELMGRLLNLLQDFNGKQIIVTTHSALVLNYLADEAAQKSVVLLYRNTNRGTQAKPFFAIKGMAERLELLGPGEVMADTNLEELSRELAQSDACEGDC